MVSRRRFLQAGAITAALPLAAQSSLAAADDTSLPPSIAKLKSRKNEATPITPEERSQRQERARKLMSENSLDAIVLMEGTSLRYFTGMRWWGGERLFAMVLPVKGTPFYVCPAFEEGRAREQLANAPDGANVDVRTWQEDESPYRLVAQGMKERGIGKAWNRRDDPLRLCGRHCESGTAGGHCECDPGHRRLPHDQESDMKSRSCVWHRK